MMKNKTKKTIIVGGVAGGATAAARLRRLSEDMEIIMFERGEYISYANCGLPYYIGGVIEDRENLFVVGSEKFRGWFNVDVRIRSEVMKINRDKKEVEVIDHRTGNKYNESYDYLILSPGAEPIRPPLDGIDLPGIFTLRSVNDTDRIFNFIKDNNPRRAVVVGGGFIGLEMAENLHHRGIGVSVVEMAPQLLTVIDKDMAAYVHQYLRVKGVHLYLSNGVAGFIKDVDKNTGLRVNLNEGESLDGDMVILAIGVKPEINLAKEAGLETGRGILVNYRMQTSDPSIYALGDAVEMKEFVSGMEVVIPLAGPANKQGRIVADNIAGRDSLYGKTQGTSVLKVFEQTVACTGANERVLNMAGLEYRRCYIHPQSNAGYYPGGAQMTLKLLFSPDDGKILGAQAVGFGGVDKRIDVIATAIRGVKTVYDLMELELAYAPPYSSAKDPVNMAGYVAANILQGDIYVTEPEELLEKGMDGIQLVDVRETEEFEVSGITGSVNIPLSLIRERLSQLSPDMKTVLVCQVGKRAYFGTRILMQKGFINVSNLNGGLRQYQILLEDKKNFNSPKINLEEDEMFKNNNLRGTDSVETIPDKSVNASQTIILDLCGLQCPGPIMEVFRKSKDMKEGELLEAMATDPGFLTDISSWCSRTGNTLLEKGEKGGKFYALICRGTEKPEVMYGGGPKDASFSSETISKPDIPRDKTLVIFSGDLDRAIASFIIATGAASMDRKVTMFFTFWGLNILRRSQKRKVEKPFMDRMFGSMMPRGSKKLGLSRMNMMGMGPKMIRKVMEDKNVDSLETLVENALSLGIRIVACQMSMDVMGLKPEELIDGVEFAGVASYLDAAEESNVNLFI